MRYRTKIYLLCLSIAAISSTLGISILYAKTSHLLKFELRTKVISVAATASALIEPSLIQEVANSLDITSPEYIKLQRQLLEARDNNRRPDLYVKYLYILKPSPLNPRQMIFLAEAENAVTPGQIDTQENQSKVLLHLNEFYSPFTFIHDKWGVWMSGFAPIIDSQGNYVATLGVDISGASVEAELNRMVKYGIISFIASLLLAFILANVVSKKITTSLQKLCYAVNEISLGDYHYHLKIDSEDEFSELAKSINTMSSSLLEKEKIKNNFSKYVSKFVLDKALSQEEMLHLEGERKKITVLFSDIRHFTLLAEKLPPEEVVSLLNEYFDVMLNVIIANHGTLDKFLGDGIMVEFGAPLSDSEQEIHAVKTAIEMQKEMEKLSIRWEKEGKPVFEIGIGIHTGFAIVGNIGSERRMEYTAIGDTVNVASRLEQATKSFKEKILISEETFLALNSAFPYKLIGNISLPGRNKEITVYAVYPSENTHSSK